MRTFLRRSLAPLSTALALLGAVALLLGAPEQARAQMSAQSDLLGQFEDKVTTFTLDNGLTFVIVERHDAPVISFNTYADVGSVNEPRGQTGIAHMFEHIAFKGTTTIGTTGIEAEMDLLEEQEAIFQELKRERAQGAQADTARINELEQEFKVVTEKAKELVEQNEFDRILQQAGMTGLNASTSSDATNYYYSLPENKIELFFALESDRFLNPVLREFYTERDVVMEERRSSESQPIGRLIEEMMATAFKAHPYGQPTIGHMSDLRNLTRTQARDFFDKYYNASNLTIGIAGDVNPQNARQLAEKYFGRLESGQEPLPVTTEEPEQISERRVIIREQSQPITAVGWHRPSGQAEEDPAFQVLQNVLSGGRTSRFYTELQETNKALQAQVLPAFPGSKYPSLFLALGVPSGDTGPEELEQEIYAVLEDIKENGITEEELQRAKTSARVSLINGLDSNQGLASQLARYEAVTGDWRNAFREIERIQNVTAEEVQQVAQETFQRDNRTVALIKNVSSEEGAATASAE